MMASAVSVSPDDVREDRDEFRVYRARRLFLACWLRIVPDVVLSMTAHS